jgi:hypothetical protein
MFLGDFVVIPTVVNTFAWVVLEMGYEPELLWIPEPGTHSRGDERTICLLGVDPPTLSVLNDEIIPLVGYPIVMLVSLQDEFWGRESIWLIIEPYHWVSQSSR